MREVLLKEEIRRSEERKGGAPSTGSVDKAWEGAMGEKERTEGKRGEGIGESIWDLEGLILAISHELGEILNLESVDLLESEEGKDSRGDRG